MPQSPVNVTCALRGVDFPASKTMLVEQARNRGAGQDVLEALDSFPHDKEFKSMAEVIKVYEEADCVPQTGIIDKRP
jgi:hypothetical protein